MIYLYHSTFTGYTASCLYLPGLERALDDADSHAARKQNIHNNIMSVTYLPNRVAPIYFHQIQLFGQQTFEEPDWKEALRIFNDNIIREDPGSMMRPYLSVEGVTLHYDQETYSYFVYGKMPEKDEEEEHSAIRAETGRVVQTSLRRKGDRSR